MSTAQGPLAVVILHYGRPELTGRLHGQLLDSDPAYREHILVLDNNAPEPYPGAWTRLPENLYWAGALEYALLTLGQAGYSRVWFLNNDIFFVTPPPHIGRAVARLALLERRLGRIGIYSPAAEKNPYHPQMVRDPARQYRLVSLVDGIAPLISVECARQVGLDFAGNAYGYGVDLWFSHLVAEQGWNLVLDHQVAVRHVYHSTARRVDGFMARAGAAQDAYLAQRFGPDAGAVVAMLQARYRDSDDM